jgi:hypothetical protein
MLCIRDRVAGLQNKYIIKIIVSGFARVFIFLLAIPRGKNRTVAGIAAVKNVFADDFIAD